MLRLALLFSAILVGYDAVVALIAKAVSVSYDSFVIPALVLMLFMGILAGRIAGSWGAIAPVAIAAVVETTIGWYVAALIGPGFVPGWTTRVLIVSAIEMWLLSTAIGGLGVWIGLMVSGSRRGLS